MLWYARSFTTCCVLLQLLPSACLNQPRPRLILVMPYSLMALTIMFLYDSIFIIPTTGQVTLEAWIKPLSLGQRAALVVKGPTTDNWDYGLYLQYNNTFLFGRHLAGQAQSTTLAQANIWYHLAGVYNNRHWQLYVNGTLEADRPSGVTTLQTGGGIAIGRKGETTVNSHRDWTRGVIDEVRLWNIALDSSVIKEWYQKPLNSTHPAMSSLIGYWSLNNGSGLVATDSSIYGNDGTLINGPVWMGSTITSYTGKIPTIIAPGIMGSPLYNNTSDFAHLEWVERIWVDKLKATFSDDYLNVLALAENGQDPADESYNIVKAPLPNDAGRTISNELNSLPLSPFKDFISHLESNGYQLDDYNDNHQVQENLFFYTYDWRKSLTSNGDSLSYFIDSVRKWTGSPQVNIVAHSMGGLVAKQTILKDGTGRIHKLIFVGTPHLGAPKIEYVMFTGEIITGWKDWLANEYTLKYISRNMPSSYSLMPSEDYFDVSLNNGLSNDVGLYELCFSYHNGLGYRFLDYGDTKTFFQNVAWPLADAEFNADLIEAAYSKHMDLSNVDFGSIEVYNLAGFGLKTISQVGFTGKADPEMRAVPVSLFTGDETVPLRSAEVANRSLTRANYYVRGVEHSRLFANVGTQQLLRRLLADPPDTAGFTHSSITTDPPASYLMDGWLVAASSPVELHAYDSFGNHTGSTGDSTWENNIPGSYYLGGKLSYPHSPKEISLPQGEYEVIVRSVDTTADFRFQVERAENGLITGYTIFDSVPTTPNFEARMQLSAAAWPASFAANYDGDSIYEATIWPDQLQISQPVNAGWNLLSIPLAEAVKAAETYLNATSAAYIFTSGYNSVDSLIHGQGFWVKFTAEETLTLFGQGNFQDSIPVQPGWNIVGGLSAPIPVDSVTSDPVGIMATDFYYFNDGYLVADTLRPGLGYWVKTNQAGKIILRAQ